jgi:hypothetical protein
MANFDTAHSQLKLIADGSQLIAGRVSAPAYFSVNAQHLGLHGGRPYS